MEEVGNLRSNNSKNALALWVELFTQPIKYDLNSNEKMWCKFIEEVFPSVLLKCTYEKAFIANVAKLGTVNASKAAILPELCHVLVETGIKTKNMNLCEYSLLCVTHFVKGAHKDFFGTVVGLSLGEALGSIVEAKKTRFTKVVKPILKDIEGKGIDLNIYLHAALMTEFKAEAEEDSEMMEKDQNPAEICTKRVGLIMTELVPAKKVDKSSTFRSFMRTQKQEIGGAVSGLQEKKSMTMGPQSSFDATLVMKEDAQAKPDQSEPAVKKEE